VPSTSISGNGRTESRIWTGTGIGTGPPEREKDFSAGAKTFHFYRDSPRPLRIEIGPGIMVLNIAAPNTRLGAAVRR
jgi:hypothetical protein